MRDTAGTQHAQQKKIIISYNFVHHLWLTAGTPVLDFAKILSARSAPQFLL